MNYRYSATGPDGDVLVGFVEADDEAAARDQLQARGIVPELMEHVVTEPATSSEKTASVRLSTSEQTEAIGQIGSMIGAGVPLSAGLWTLAEEMPSKRLRVVFRGMSLQLEQGRSLSDVLTDHAESLPQWLTAVLKAGSETGRVAESVQHYVRFTRVRTQQIGRLVVCLIYPSILIAIAGCLGAFMLTGLAPQFIEIFEGFGTQLPGATQLLVSASRLAEEILRNWEFTFPATFVAVALILMALRALVGPSGFRRMIYEIPVVGRMLKLTALSDFCNLLALLVENRTPLPRAFDLVSISVQDPSLSLAAAEAAVHLTNGVSPTRLRSYVPELPDELLRISGWESGEQDLADSLRAASDVFCIQSEVIARSLTGFLPPLTILAIAGGVSFFVVAMFMPLVRLLNDLS